MKKFIHFFYLTFCILNSVLSQTRVTHNIPFTEIEFAENAPSWHYSVRDPDIIGALHYAGIKCDGYNTLIPHIKIHNRISIIDDKDLYISELSAGTNGNLFGVVIQKIDIKTGTPLWSSYFDNRDSNDNQEYFSSMYLIPNTDTLVVISARNTKKWDERRPFDNLIYPISGDADATLSIRKYDKNTGRLLVHHFIDTPDQRNFRTKVNGYKNPILYRESNNDYLYVQYLVLNKDSQIIWSHIDSNAILKGQKVETLHHPDHLNIDEAVVKNTIFIDKEHIYFLEDFDDLDENRKQYAYIHIYDHQMNKQSVVDLYKIINEIDPIFDGINDLEDAYIIDVRNDVIHLFINTLDKNHFDIYYDAFITTKGELLYLHENSFLPDIQEDYISIDISYLPISHKLVAVASKGKSLKDAAKQGGIDFYIYENKHWIKKYSIKAADKYVFKRAPLTQQLKNGDLLINTLWTKYDSRLDSFAFLHTTWMRVDGSKLGLRVATTQIEEKGATFAVAPNPIRNRLMVHFNDPVTGSIQLMDAYGRIGINKYIHQKTDIDFGVRNLPRGIYFIRFKDEIGKVQIKKVSLQ